ncbi:MAG: aldo/keto reductase [Dorea sp.]|nr:aldo/keto reductase [Dorea sp.]
MKKLCCTVLVFLLLISMAACQKVEQTPDAPVESEQREREDKESEEGGSGADEKAALSEKEDDTLKREFNFETKTVMLNSGYEMPINGIGTYSLQDETCVDAVSEALRRGVRLIDTAYMYHNEESVGQAVRESGIPREEIFVITKLYPNQFSDAPAAIEEALQKLDISYIDMMLLHHPGSGDVEAYHAMEKAVEEGKIRSIGLSNWYVEELESFLPQVNITPALVQNEIHPYYQENDVIPYIQDLGIVVQGWYPLGGRGHTAELLGDEVISEIAREHGKSSAQVILRWNLQKGVVVIPGSSNPDHIQENTELYNFELTEEEMEHINSLDRNEKHDWY